VCTLWLMLVLLNHQASQRSTVRMLCKRMFTHPRIHPHTRPNGEPHSTLIAEVGVQGTGNHSGYMEELLLGLNLSHEQAAGLLLSCPSLLQVEPQRARTLIHGLSKLLRCTHRCGTHTIGAEQGSPEVHVTP